MVDFDMFSDGRSAVCRSAVSGEIRAAGAVKKWAGVWSWAEPKKNIPAKNKKWGRE